MRLQLAQREVQPLSSVGGVENEILQGAPGIVGIYQVQAWDGGLRDHVRDFGLGDEVAQFMWCLLLKGIVGGKRRQDIGVHG